MPKRWIFAPKHSDDLIEQLLVERGVIEPKTGKARQAGETSRARQQAIERFLEPVFGRDVTDPFKIMGIGLAVKRIKRAIATGESIGLFSDFDADGVTAAALVHETILFLISQIGKTPQFKIEQVKPSQIKPAQVYVYIPSREQGYGLSQEGIDWLKARSVSLLITLDLGIKSVREISYAKTQIMDVIVIDHHLPPKDFVKHKPEAIVINPKQPGDRSGFKEFCAAGLAWKLSQALTSQTGQINYKQILNPKQEQLKSSQSKLDRVTKGETGETGDESQASQASFERAILSVKQGEAFVKWLLDLAAIGTICDIVPLVGENRLIAKFGLLVARKTRRLGLQALYQAAGIKPNSITSYHVGFQIGPRLNAPGRLLEAAPSFNLLVSRDDDSAKRLANELNQINAQRQAELDRVIQEARARVIKDKLAVKKVIMVSGENWPAGIVGLVAGRLMDEFGRPSIVLSQEGDRARGSARSIEAFHIVEALEHASRYLDKFGGHARAAGLSLETKHLKAVYDLLLAQADKRLSEQDVAPSIQIDRTISLSEINLALINRLNKLEPHGFGNRRPVFGLIAQTVVARKSVGRDGKHVQLIVEETSRTSQILSENQKSPVINPKSETGSQFQITPAARALGKASQTGPAQVNPRLAGEPAQLSYGSSGVRGRAIYFNGDLQARQLKSGDVVDLAVVLGLDQWQGQKRVQVSVLDWRPSQMFGQTQK